MKIKRNRKSIEKLAREVVDGWDMDDLIGYAVQQLMIYYIKDKKGFEKDWEETFGDN